MKEDRGTVNVIIHEFTLTLEDEIHTIEFEIWFRIRGHYISKFRPVSNEDQFMLDSLPYKDLLLAKLMEIALKRYQLKIRSSKGNLEDIEKRYKEIGRLKFEPYEKQ